MLTGDCYFVALQLCTIFPTCSQCFPTFCLSVFQSLPTCFPSVFQGKKQWSRRCRPKIIATWQCRVTHPTPRVMAPWGRPRLCPPQAMDTSNLQARTVELCSRFSFGEGVWAKILLELKDRITPQVNFFQQATKERQRRHGVSKKEKRDGDSLVWSKLCVDEYV